MGNARKASAYSKRIPVSNTRKSKKLQKSYVKTIPPQKIVKFNIGNIKKFEAGEFRIKGTISAGENIQIRDMALEAIRQGLNKDMTNLFQNDFFMRVNVYPHNILRNNRVFSGASKGERVQTGMSKGFGSSEGRAAVVKNGQSIFSLYFNSEDNIHKVRGFIKKVTPKLACRTIVKFEKLGSNL
ncbi:MAG: 50S ribosomal protein L16 [Nanoarchaeota archaeon]